MPRNQFSSFKNSAFLFYSKLPFFLKKGLAKIISYKTFRSVRNVKSPSTLIFYATDKCNARCKHCFYWKNLNRKTKELSIDKIGKIAESLKNPLDLLVITGGEPFLRDDIVEVCNTFYKSNGTRRISIDTNGIFSEVIYDKVKLILGGNPGKQLSVFISLDGLEKTHDRMRGCKGSFASVEKTLNLLKKLESAHKNLTIMVATTVTKDNIDELNDLVRFVGKFDVLHKFNLLRSNSSVFNIPSNLLNDFNPQEIAPLSLDELEHVYGIVSKNKDLGSRIETMKIRKSIDMLRSKKRLVSCLASYNNAVVFPDGSVSICEPTKPFANLKDFDYNLCKALNSQKALEHKNKLRNCFCLQPCNLLDAMKWDTDTLVRL